MIRIPCEQCGYPTEMEEAVMVRLNGKQLYFCGVEHAIWHLQKVEE